MNNDESGRDDYIIGKHGPSYWMPVMMEFRMLTTALTVIDSLRNQLNAHRDICISAMAFDSLGGVENPYKDRIYLVMYKAFVIISDMIMAVVGRNMKALNRSIEEMQAVSQEYVSIIREMTSQDPPDQAAFPQQ